MKGNNESSATEHSRLYKLDPVIEDSNITYDSLESIWSAHQDCYFLVMYGKTEDGMPEEVKISVNLLPKVRCPVGYFFARDDDYKASLVAELVSRQILRPTGVRTGSGFIKIPLFVFNSHLLTGVDEYGTESS